MSVGSEDQYIDFSSKDMGVHPIKLNLENLAVLNSKHNMAPGSSYHNMGEGYRDGNNSLYQASHDFLKQKRRRRGFKTKNSMMIERNKKYKEQLIEQDRARNLGRGIRTKKRKKTKGKQTKGKKTKGKKPKGKKTKGKKRR